MSPLSSLLSFLKTSNDFLIRNKTLTSILFLSAVGGLTYLMFYPPQNTQETVLVTNGTLRQYVKVSGQVQSSHDASLSFQTGGAVSFVGVKVGDAVRQGQILATLSGGDAQATLLQAQASLQNAEAVLGKLVQGARKEEIDVKQQAVDNAQNSLDQSYNAIPDVLQNVEATTADVIKNKLSQLFVATGERYVLSFSSCDQRLQSVIEGQRSLLENTLADFQKKNSLITAISSREAIEKAFDSAYASALNTNELVNSVSNLLLEPCSMANISLDSQRLALSSVKVSMTTLFSDITAKRSAFITAKNSFSQASRDLDLTKAGTDPYTIKAQRALVTQAEAQVIQAKSGLAKTIVTAPFKGVISDVSIVEGETVTSGKTVITMLALDAFEIEAKIPEIDIVKIKTGGAVDVTLDAYGQAVVFKAKVTRINPSATTEGSVPVYKVIITFLGQDVRIKPGMTANVNIVTEERLSADMLPARFVKVKNDSTGTVLIIENGKRVTRDVVLGIRGEGGLIEIKRGLIEGEMVLAPTTVTRSSQKQTQ